MLPPHDASVNEPLRPITGVRNPPLASALRLHPRWGWMVQSRCERSGGM